MAAMNMNQEQFKQLIREEKPVLVDFCRLSMLRGARLPSGECLTATGRCARLSPEK